MKHAQRSGASPPSREVAAWREILDGIAPGSGQGIVSLHMGALLESSGRLDAARAAYVEFTAAHPRSIDALRRLASVCARLGRTTESVEWRLAVHREEARRLAEDPATRDAIAHFRLAAEGHGPTPERAPADFVRAYFDEYAGRFDAHLVDRLHYAGPDAVVRGVRELLGSDPKALDILDLGCGTGLTGQSLTPWVGRLTGVDLSPEMIAQAREKDVYTSLVVGDLHDTLGEVRDPFDLVVASDVLTYLGDLSGLFEGIAGALRPGGHAIVNTEADDGVASFRLGVHGRFAHSLGYLRKMAEQASFEMSLTERFVMRTQNRRPVPAFLVGLRRL